MKSWVKRIESFLNKETKTHHFKYSFYNDDPETLNEKMIYIIGERPHFWKLSFICPCGCKEVISLNLLQEVSPNWTFKVKKKRITIHPSIWRSVGCKSHFYIKKGKLDWSYLD